MGEEAKKVTTRGWDKTAPLASADFAEDYVKGRCERRNPAVVLRPSGLVGIDCDTREGLAQIQALGLPETVTVMSSASYKLHFWFRPHAPNPEYVAFRFEDGEVAADTGRYFVCPPALHPSGKVYSFLRSPEDHEIATLPEEIYRRLVELAKKDGKATAGDAPKILPTEIRDGQWHTRMVSATGLLLKQGWVEAAAAAEALVAQNRATYVGVGEVDDEEVRALVHDVYGRYEAGEGGPLAPGFPESERVSEIGRSAARREQEEASEREPFRLSAPREERLSLETPSRADFDFETAAQFAAVEEQSEDVLLGDEDDGVALAADDTVITYGDGGAGKTTLELDRALHLATG